MTFAVRLAHSKDSLALKAGALRPKEEASPTPSLQVSHRKTLTLGYTKQRKMRTETSTERKVKGNPSCREKYQRQPRGVFPDIHRHASQRCREKHPKTDRT